MKNNFARVLGEWFSKRCYNLVNPGPIGDVWCCQIYSSLFVNGLGEPLSWREYISFIYDLLQIFLHLSVCQGVVSGSSLTCGCVGSVLQAEVFYSIFIYTSYNRHGSFDIR